VNDSGSDSDSETLSGAYLGGRLLWRVNEDWRLRAGVEYEYLKEWEGRFSTHSARLDFSRSFYATFGLQREF